MLTLILVSVPPHCYGSATEKILLIQSEALWQVTAKHTSTLRMWLWMKWHCNLLRGCVVVTACVLWWSSPDTSLCWLLSPSPSLVSGQHFHPWMVIGLYSSVVQWVCVALVVITPMVAALGSGDGSDGSDGSDVHGFMIERFGFKSWLEWWENWLFILVFVSPHVAAVARKRSRSLPKVQVAGYNCVHYKI